MLPESLFGSYKQYKTDTTKIASWLAETAEKCGWTDLTHIGSNGDATKDEKAPKLKGRARKLARDAAAAEKKGQTSSQKVDIEPPKHIIRIKDFVLVAAYIASNSSSITIPYGFLNLIKRCIMARTSTTNWYSNSVARGDDEAKESVEKHSHFTSVLEDVFRTLISRFSASSKASKEDSKVSQAPRGSQLAVADAKSAPLANLFELLSVEDTDGDIDHVDDFSASVPITTTPEPSEPPKARYKIEHDEEHEEAEWFFSLQLFFTTFTFSNSCLRKLGRAVTTNTAFDLVRRAESDFLREMPIPKNYKQFANGADLCYLLYIDISVAKGCGPTDTEKPHEMFDFRRYEDVEYSFLVPYLCLRDFEKEVKERKGRIPMMSVEEERQLVTGPRSDLTPREKHQQDVTLLMSSVAVFASFVHVSNAPSEDEFCAGIRDLVEKHKYPLWLVFAAQNYLDVHHILGTDVGRGLKELQMAGNAAKATLEEHFRFMKAKKGVLRDRKDENSCREMLRSIEEWGCNTQEAKLLNKYATRKSGTGWDEHCVVKKHPLLAGLLKFSIHLMMQYEGILLLNSITVILSIAHLYNAVQVEGYLPKDKPWQDLEFVLNVHSSQDIFVGDRPTNPEDYAKRMALSQGISPETFARNRRSTGPKFSKKGSRELNSVPPVAGAFRERYCSGGSADLSIKLAEELIHELVLNEGVPKASLKKEHLISAKSNRLRLRLEDFLEYLAEALQREAPQYHLDYFALHRRSWVMMQEILDRVYPLVKESFTEIITKKFDAGHGIVMIPSIIIAMACDVTKSPSMFHLKRSLRVDVEPLKITAAEMEKLIDREGDVEIRRLREVCPGFE